ncbi:MAG: hypothetical protein HYZ58_15310, partial [Acidobacteria bacterium]|nr:hypothetical protein [Acidobacteriota bacterium]
MIRLTYDPELVEEAVLLAEARSSRRDAGAFRRDRDRIYDLADADQREASFRSLHLCWFTRMGLNRVIEQALRERPDIARVLSTGRVVRARARGDEGADLVDHVIPGELAPRPMLVLRLRPATLVAPDALGGVLRHELMHVADMLDPLFGYQRTLPSSDGGHSHDNILRDRYRVLW